MYDDIPYTIDVFFAVQEKTGEYIAGPFFSQEAPELEVHRQDEENTRIIRVELTGWPE